jgi:hypothetical protein
MAVPSPLRRTRGARDDPYAAAPEMTLHRSAAAPRDLAIARASNRLRRSNSTADAAFWPGRAYSRQSGDLDVGVYEVWRFRRLPGPGEGHQRATTLGLDLDRRT